MQYKWYYRRYRGKSQTVSCSWRTFYAGKQTGAVRRCVFSDFIVHILSEKGGETVDENGKKKTVRKSTVRTTRAVVPAEEDKGDEVAKKTVYSLCYIFGILFFLPLLLYKDGESKRHANEGLVLLLLGIVGNLIFWIFMGFGGAVGRLFGIVSCVYTVLLLLLGIAGIVYVVTDRRKSLPILGNIKIIK